MSLPNYLAKIKSSGIYRFVWDKSEVPPQTAETLRLVVGYSEKGPFNTPVYIDNTSDFISIYGNISKKLERKGIFFHRMALQALSGGPILALNLKPFTDKKDDETNYEKVTYVGLDGKEIIPTPIIKTPTTIGVVNLYDTNRFWYLDADQLPEKTDSGKYITIAATDTKDTSCSVFIRPYHPSSYNITIRQWYANYASTEEMPSYLEPIQDELLSKYFAEIYVFKGKFTKDLVQEGGPLGTYISKIDDNGASRSESWQGYLNWDNTNGVAYINEGYVNMYGELEDALVKLAEDSSSNFIATYQGCLIPYFKDGMGNYVSLDILFNSGNSTHKMLMKLDESLLEGKTYAELNDLLCEQEEYYEPYGEWKLNESVGGDASKYTLKKAQPNPTEYYASLPEHVYIEVEKVKEYYNLTSNDNNVVDYVKVEGTPSNVADYSYAKNLPSTKISIKDDSNTYYYDLVYRDKDQDTNKLSPIYLEGYTYKTIDNSDSGLILQNKILNQLKDKGIRTALTNRVDVEYHYIIDTFQSYISQGCKSELAQIAKEKDNAFALLNFPPLSAFVADSRFKSDVTGKFDINNIADMSKGFSLVSEINGASWCAYFTGVTFSDGTLKQNVPSAAIVSNNFMEKYGARQPYYIVAGPSYGRIAYDGLVGPDYNYGRSDLDVLEPLGVNAIIYVPRKGTYINSNQTAKQTPISALSKIHVRELVIYLQNEIESMLQNYQWELNTQTLRDTIKAKADTILENVKNNGGIYAYTNVCDETNNTAEVIDNEMVILDTAIEPARGCGKMVQQLTIHRTGGITSSTTA